MAYSQEEKQNIVDSVCKEIAENNASLRKALELKDTPNRSTFYEWLENNQHYSDQYARACKDRADNIFEEILEIADDSSSDTIISEDGKELFNNEFAARSRIKIDARKWMLGKMNPIKYSDKIQVDKTPFKEQPLFPDVSKNNRDK